METIVELKNISKIYQQGEVEVKAVNDVSLAINKGDFAVLCGPSGSGKTSILNLIGGLDEPTMGDVWLEGVNLAHQTNAQLAEIRKNRIGFVFQAYNLIPDEVDQSRDVKFALGLEHRFENTLTLRWEQFYQGVGVTDHNDYNAAILTNKTTSYLARNYTALGINYEVTPLLLGDAVWLFNNDDSSSLLAMYASYSLSDESEIALGVNLPIGERPNSGIISSEFGLYSTSFSVDYRLYF